MRSILELLSRYGNFTLFLFLQAICFFLIINYNHTQKEIFMHSASVLSGRFLSEKNQVNDYFSLREINNDLANENARLKERLIHYEGYGDPPSLDSLLGYKLLPAKVINQSIHLRNNYLTIDIGSEEGITKDMGVISEKGLVGIVKNVSKNYCQVISVLNSSTRISGRFKSKGYLGNLIWSSTDPSKLTMEAVPKYANVEKGDTIVTSGFSTIFPKGLQIGVVSDFYLENGISNYTIEVLMAEELAKLEYVYLIDDKYRDEKISFDNSIDE